jgi:hypothetical protein
MAFPSFVVLVSAHKAEFAAGKYQYFSAVWNGSDSKRATTATSHELFIAPADKAAERRKLDL